MELKNVLARQPGPEVAEQLAVYQQNLKEKQRQMKAMNSELEMYKVRAPAGAAVPARRPPRPHARARTHAQAQVSEYKYDIERLNDEMERLRQRYFKRMRKQMRSHADASMPLPPGEGGYRHSSVAFADDSSGAGLPRGEDSAVDAREEDSAMAARYGNGKASRGSASEVSGDAGAVRAS